MRRFYRGGPKVRNSGRKRPEAKRVGGPPPGGNFKTSPLGNSSGTPASATKRLPVLSKARPKFDTGLSGSPGTEPKTIRSPLGVNLKIVPAAVGLVSVPMT